MSILICRVADLRAFLLLLLVQATPQHCADVHIHRQAVLDKRGTPGSLRRVSSHPPSTDTVRAPELSWLAHVMACSSCARPVIDLGACMHCMAVLLHCECSTVMVAVLLQ
jgi:hypothetical protein